MNSIPNTSTDNISHTLMLRLRCRNLARRAAARTGRAVDTQSMERAVIGVYRATGNKHAGIRTMHDIFYALVQTGQGGGAA